MFKIFVRNWWKSNPTWPNGLEPHPTARKKYIGEAETEDQAQRLCREYNEQNPPGRLSRKAEYES